MALTYKQKAFAEAYLLCGNATKAAKMAGYSEKTARSLGCENLTKPDIKILIQERLKEKRISADKVLALLSLQAEGSLEYFLDIHSDGFASIDISTLQARDHLRLIRKLKIKHSRRIVGRGRNAQKWEDETIEIELYDAQKALIMLGRYYGLFNNNRRFDLFRNEIEYEKALDTIYGPKKRREIKENLKLGKGKR
jgi:phage terminase small subunit